MIGLLRAVGVSIALVLLGPLQAALAAEQILDFDVLVEVRLDGEFFVTETIRVKVEGREIKRGIIRDFPIKRRDADGGSRWVSFNVESIRRNGDAEPYKLSFRGEIASLRIGQADRRLRRPSEQTYEIRYRTQGQLRSFEGYDELYWNVTGDRWSFPIRRASVEIRLPGHVEIQQHAAYTGRHGLRGRDFSILEAEGNRFRATTTATLKSGEGFTVAVGWPPGLVTVQSASGEHSPEARYAAVGATLVGAAVLLLLWIRVGRNPEKDVIYPRFEPPEGVGPAAACYLRNMGYERRCLTAAIISMAVKGALRISDRAGPRIYDRSTYALEPLGAEGKALTYGEQGVYQSLFPIDGSVDLIADEYNGPKLDRARNELRSRLWHEHYGASFNLNLAHSIAGGLAGPAALLPLWLFGRIDLGSLLQWLIPAVLSVILTYVVAVLTMEVTDIRRGVVLRWKRILGAFVPALVGVVIVLKLLDDNSRGGLAGIIDRSDPVVMLAGAVFGAVVALFHFLMAAPTKSGRKLMDHIDGFALYLRTAEEDRLDVINPPERTPELFERLLPYAIALGLSHQWSAKFADVVTGTMTPDWYEGSGSFDYDGFGRDFGHSVSATSTPVADSSSGSGFSGSGGGGFSGGGGGGGGGSGW